MGNPYWDEVWERKGNTSDDLRTSCGWEDTTCSAKDVYKVICSDLKLSPANSILEVGCGSGHLASQFLNAGHEYYGVDNSSSLISIASKSFPQTTFAVSEANSLEFPDNSFDYVIVYSVFQYFPDYEYAKRCIDEMNRVSKTGIYIGDLVESSDRDTHLKFTKDNFVEKWQLSKGVYTSRRFNVFRRA